MSFPSVRLRNVGRFTHMSKQTSKGKSRKRKVARVHSASAYLSVNSLTKAGSSLWLNVSADGELLGKLEIGRGGFCWTGRYRKISRHLSWSRFAELMDKNGYGK